MSAAERSSANRAGAADQSRLSARTQEERPPFEPPHGWREVQVKEAPHRDYLYLNEDDVDRWWVRNDAPTEQGYWRDANGHIWTVYDDGSIDDGWGNPVDWNDAEPPTAPFVPLQPIPKGSAILSAAELAWVLTWAETEKDEVGITEPERRLVERLKEVRGGAA